MKLHNIINRSTAYKAHIPTHVLSVMMSVTILSSAILSGCSQTPGSQISTDEPGSSATDAAKDAQNADTRNGGSGSAGEGDDMKRLSGSGRFSEKPAAEISEGNYTNGISCHDPQIIPASDGSYYMTGSHMILAKSDDLDKWEYISNGSAKKYISNLYSGSLDAFKYVGKNEEGGYSVWAGNIFYNEQMEKYLLYFCTSSTYIKSTLALAVSDKPEGPYTYTDTLLYSGFTGSTVEETNLYEILGKDADVSRYLKLGGYNNNDWPNCIDPAVFTDAEGRQWMVYGSWSGGLFLLEIDPSTGLVMHPLTRDVEGASADVEGASADIEGENAPDPYFGYHLIGGGHHACEGPYIEYVPETGYYYLFASFGGLTRTGGYQIRQFRSKNPTGPYLDMNDNLMGNEEDYMSYGLKMAGNYSFPSLKTAYMAPGGQSVFKGTDGNMYITYHQRFDNGSEYHEPRVHRLFLNEDGWFVMSPFETVGETLDPEGYKTEDLAGTFYIVDHERDVSDIIHRHDAYMFSNGMIYKSDDLSSDAYGADGSTNGLGDDTAFSEETDAASAQSAGTYETEDGSAYIHISLEGRDYRGVIVEMTDEAGNHVLCIMACGENETVWAVQYLK